MIMTFPKSKKNIDDEMLRNTEALETLKSIVNTIIIFPRLEEKEKNNDQPNQSSFLDF